MKFFNVKTAIAAVCVVAAGFGGVKAYNAANQSEADMLLAENVEALSSGDASTGIVNIIIKLVWNGSKKMKISSKLEWSLFGGLVEHIISNNQVAYSKWVVSEYKKHVTYYPNGREKDVVYGHLKTCTEFTGSGEGDCSPVGSVKIID